MKLKTDVEFYEKCIVYKDYDHEGFRVLPHDLTPDSEELEFGLKHAKYFMDSRHKVLIDNKAPYGHFITNWLYVLITELEFLSLDPKDVLVLMFSNPNEPGTLLNHMCTVTEYLHERLTEKGYDVQYVDAQYSYITNYHHFVAPFYVPQVLLPPVVGRFLAEGLTTSSYGKKIYLSRSKTTTSNGNRNVYLDEHYVPNTDYKEHLKKVREEKQYQFSDRIDDEQRLEEYLKSLGFEVLVPEDFDSFRDQLSAIAGADVVASITSSTLFGLMVLKPGAKIIEFCTPEPTVINSSGYFLPESDIFNDHFRSVALAKGHLYICIPNRDRKVAEVIQHIETTPELKLLMSS